MNIRSFYFRWSERSRRGGLTMEARRGWDGLAYVWYVSEELGNWVENDYEYDRIQGTSYYYFSNRVLQKFKRFPWVTGTVQYAKISTRTHRLRILQKKGWVSITFGCKNAQYVLKNPQFSSILLYKIEFSSQLSSCLCSAFLQFLTIFGGRLKM